MERPPNPLDIAYWLFESDPPKFDEEYFIKEVKDYIERNNPWEKLGLGANDVKD